MPATNATWRDVNLDTFIDRVEIPALIGFSPTQVFFVHGTLGASTNDGLSRAAPLATLAQALAKCADSQGDVVVLMAGHTETLSATATTTCSKIGVTIIGYGNARNRPAITCGAGDVVGLTVSGTSNRIKNVRFIGNTAQTSAASVILSVTGTDNTFENCVFEHGGAGPLVAVLLTAAHRTTFRDSYWRGTAAGPDMAIKTTGAIVNDFLCERCIFNYGDVNVDSAVIGGLASGGYAQSIFQDLVMLGANSSAIRNLGSAAATVPDSLIARVYVASSAGITAGSAMPFDCGGAALANCFWTDAVAAASAWLGVAQQHPGTPTNVNKAYVLSPGPS